MDWDEWAEKRRIYAMKYATGEDGQITHSTGREFDEKVKKGRKEYKDNKQGGAKHPGFTYKHDREKEKAPALNKKDPAPQRFKKVIIDY